MSASPAAIGSNTRRRFDPFLSAYTQAFADEHNRRVVVGAEIMKSKTIVFAGLARNCGVSLSYNLQRIREFGENCKGWKALVFENDSTDDTKIIANEAAKSHDNITAMTHDFGRAHRPGEFAGPRTIELAEYRAGCQSWIAKNCADFDYVAIIDWDMWGGWFAAESAFSFLEECAGAYGVASLSLLEMDANIYNMEKSCVQRQPMMIHYDQWALRLNSYWDDYSNGMGSWKASWFPPVGSDPVKVCSAFGGLCVYRTQDYLRGKYSGEDCEHVPFHKSIAETTGRALYLNPSMRTIMEWTADDQVHADPD